MAKATRPRRIIRGERKPRARERIEALELHIKRLNATIREQDAAIDRLRNQMGLAAEPDYYVIREPQKRIAFDVIQAIAHALNLPAGVIPPLAVSDIQHTVGEAWPVLRRSPLSEFILRYKVRGAFDPSHTRVAQLMTLCDLLETRAYPTAPEILREMLGTPPDELPEPATPAEPGADQEDDAEDLGAANDEGTEALGEDDQEHEPSEAIAGQPDEG